MATDLKGYIRESFIEYLTILKGKLSPLETTRFRTKYVLADLKHYTDSTDREFSTSWADGFGTSDITCYSSSSFIEFDWQLPTRNNSTSWGGVGTRIYASTDNGSNWSLLGEHEFGGNVMIDGSQAMGMQSGAFIYTIGSGVTKVRFKLQHKAYDGTAWVNKYCNSSGVLDSKFIIKLYDNK